MIVTPLHDHPARITLAFTTDTPEAAVTAAEAWAHAEPHLRIKTLCSVRRGGVSDSQWLVELAVRWLE